MRYRSFTQELGILLHKPLATLPNLLRIFVVAWELDPAGGRLIAPNVSTEFAAFGALQTLS